MHLHSEHKWVLSTHIIISKSLSFIKPWNSENNDHIWTMNQLSPFLIKCQFRSQFRIHHNHFITQTHHLHWQLDHSPKCFLESMQSRLSWEDQEESVKYQGRYSWIIRSCKCSNFSFLPNYELHHGEYHLQMSLRILQQWIMGGWTSWFFLLFVVESNDVVLTLKWSLSQEISFFLYNTISNLYNWIWR